MLNQPVFCLTSDLDWASDYCVNDLIEVAGKYGVTPTLFATNESKAVESFRRANPTAVGLHPNFLPGSTHGADHVSVIDHLFQLFPGARSFRSHSFVDGSHILAEMEKHGVTHDSNLCLYLQKDIVPLRLGGTKITRFPVFWEDDAHCLQSGGEGWDFKSYLPYFESPGLKIINVHPLWLCANVASLAGYESVKQHSRTLSAENISSVRNPGAGVRTFLMELLEYLTSKGVRFHTLHELYQMFPLEDVRPANARVKGREILHTEQEHEDYSQMTDEEKQRFLRESYEKRNASDPYATSRDVHARELEIQAIRNGLAGKGKLIDLGCGNGYTLLALAKHLDSWDMTGVDFSANLVAGAEQLVRNAGDSIKSQPKFVCGDATVFVESLAKQSVRYVITERFLLNLPNVEWQKKVTRQIYEALEPGGRFLMCEGSREGFLGLNEVRSKAGLEPIPETSFDNLSAVRIDDESFEKYLQTELGFRLVAKMGLSQYFLISRVLHPLLVAPQNPRFDSKINDLARLMQECVPFAPGIGSNVLWVLEKPSS